jgi:hypothetical protein
MAASYKCVDSQLPQCGIILSMCASYFALSGFSEKHETNTYVRATFVCGGDSCWYRGLCGSHAHGSRFGDEPIQGSRAMYVKRLLSFRMRQALLLPRMPQLRQGQQSHLRNTRCRPNPSLAQSCMHLQHNISNHYPSSTTSTTPHHFPA